MGYTVPSVTDFKNYFYRDFPYGTTMDKVIDQDITKAYAEAAFNFNPELFSSQSNFTLGYLYLTAHYLTLDLRAAAQGISGSYSWLEAGKSVGSVSQSFAIPQYILDHPVLGMMSKTNYGAKFLSLILSQLVGQVFTVSGGTQA